jgi:energy-coupling factor transporter ATP-binding protein EcfA2
MTLAIEPEVSMLDDPATGLDPAARCALLEAMIYFTRSRERTIFFSTHLLDDVERVADQVAVAARRRRCRRRRRLCPRAGCSRCRHRRRDARSPSRLRTPC